MLAQIGRGHYDATHDLGSIDLRMQRLFNTASSVIVADITIESLEDLDSQLFPNDIPDLSLGSLFIISGRHNGTFPESVKVTGTLADMTNFDMELKVKREKDMQLRNVLSKRHIDLVTADAWLLGNEELKEKVIKMSIQNKVPSEYTCMVLVENNEGKKKEPKPQQPFLLQKVYSKICLQRIDIEKQKLLFLGGMSLGFGDMKATAKNIPPATKEAKTSEGLVQKAASTCCSGMANNCCGMCLLKTCACMNDQCTIVCSQLCAALACFELIKCCIELCDCDCFE